MQFYSNKIIFDQHLVHVQCKLTKAYSLGTHLNIYGITIDWLYIRVLRRIGEIKFNDKLCRKFLVCLQFAVFLKISLVRERYRNTSEIYVELSIGNRKKCIQVGVRLWEDTCMNESWLTYTNPWNNKIVSSFKIFCILNGYPFWIE